MLALMLVRSGTKAIGNAAQSHRMGNSAIEKNAKHNRLPLHAPRQKNSPE